MPSRSMLKLANSAMRLKTTAYPITLYIIDPKAPIQLPTPK